MFEDIFKRKKQNPEKLQDYGFLDLDGKMSYEAKILNGTFLLKVSVSKSGNVETDLIEIENGEPYILYKTNAAGTYVGEVRAAIEAVLMDVVEHCYEPVVFKSEQAEMVIRYVRDAYGDELEFLWTKFPDNAVWRRKDNEKWYGAILTVAGHKIGLDTHVMVEIIDLRMDAKKASDVLSRKNYYPGWHMNKKSWYTIVLDGSVPDDELRERITESYELAEK